MKSLRWTLAFLRDPISALGSSIATIRERLAPLGSEALPLAVLYRTSRKPQVASDETRYDVSAGPLK